MGLQTIIEVMSKSPWKEIVIGLISSGSTVVAYLTRKRFFTKKKDQLQDALIRQNMAQLEVVASAIKANNELLQNLTGKVDGLTEKVDKFESRNNRVDEIKKFKAGIVEIGYSLSASYNVPSAFSGMIVKGCKEAANIFGDILEGDVKTIDLKKLEIQALNSMREIRETYKAHAALPEDAAYEIKHQVARPLLAKLMSDLHLISTGYFNGKSEDRYKTLVITFINDFITQSITHGIKKVSV